MLKNKKIFLAASSLVMGLALGVFGVQNAGAQTLPAGCTSTAGYSSTSGVACNGMTSSTVAGCSSVYGFSTTTGLPCNGYSYAQNYYTGGVLGSNGFLNGCTSTSGYSTVSGQACSISTANVSSGSQTYPPGCSSFSGYSPVSGLACSVFASGSTEFDDSGTGTPTPTPGLPTTGVGNQGLNVIVLISLLAAMGFGISRILRERKS